MKQPKQDEIVIKFKRKVPQGGQKQIESAIEDLKKAMSQFGWELCKWSQITTNITAEDNAEKLYNEQSSNQK